MAGLTEGQLEWLELSSGKASPHDVRDLIAEVRRLRGLVAGLVRRGYEVKVGPHGDVRCWHCGADLDGYESHRDYCPYVNAVAACSGEPADRPVSWDMVVYSRHDTTLREYMPAGTVRKVEGRELTLHSTGPFPIDVIDGPEFIGSTVRVSLVGPTPQRGGRDTADDRGQGRKPTGH